MTLGSAPELSMTLELVPGVDAAALARQLEAAVAELRLVTLILPDIAGEKAALGAARITPSGDRVAITAPWPYEGLDRGCRRLGGLLGLGEGTQGTH